MSGIIYEAARDSILAGTLDLTTADVRQILLTNLGPADEALNPALTTVAGLLAATGVLEASDPSYARQVVPGIAVAPVGNVAVATHTLVTYPLLDVGLVIGVLYYLHVGADAVNVPISLAVLAMDTDGTNRTISAVNGWLSLATGSAASALDVDGYTIKLDIDGKLYGDGFNLATALFASRVGMLDTLDENDFAQAYRPEVTVSCNLNSTTTIVLNAGTSALLVVGQLVTGVSIPAEPPTYIQSLNVDGVTIVLTQAATATIVENVTFAEMVLVGSIADLAAASTSAAVAAAVAGLVDSAPATLDTLNELAAALADDAAFSTTVTNSLAGKVDKTALGPQSVLAAVVDSTPVGVTVETDTLVGRIQGGNITALTPAQVKAMLVIAEVWTYAIGDETTALTTGNAKITFRAPYAATVTAVRASLTTESSSGNPTFDINEGVAGVGSILSTKLTIDATERTSVSAVTPAVISDTVIADDAEMTIDCDVAGTGAKGAKISIYVVRA